MSAIDRFTDAATASGASVHSTSRTDLDELFEDLVRRPAVGTPLAIDGVSLPNYVETDPDTDGLKSAKTGITAAPLGIESFGSVVIPSDEQGTGPISLFPERQIAVLESDRLVSDMESALSRLTTRFQSGEDDVVLVTGPSTTGDMGSLVTGVHGPAELHIVVIDQ